MTRTVIRMGLFFALVVTQAAPTPVASPERRTDPIVVCESVMAPDSGDVSIGTALRLHKGADIADVAGECAGSVTLLPE